MKILIDWFSGGANQYMSGAHCMAFDWLWVWLRVLVDVAISSGYCLIAYHWHKNAKKAGCSRAKAALTTQMWIFLFCGLCGYALAALAMFWPAHRLFFIPHLFLAVITWIYAIKSKTMVVVYEDLNKAALIEKAMADDPELRGVVERLLEKAQNAK